MQEIFTLNKLDRKILYYLDENARISTIQLAKKVNSSREVIDYRIKRLIKKGVINRFFTHIQAEKTGFTSYKIYFKIKGLNEDQEKALIQYFLNNDNVYWVANCDGVYDLIIAVMARDVYQLNHVLQKCYKKYDIHFISKDITISIDITICRNEITIVMVASKNSFDQIQFVYIDILNSFECEI